MAFAIEPKTKGDEDKVFTSLRRLQEEDPTIDLHRDPQTGDQIVAGLSQIHVEVVVDRLKSRFGAEVTLKPPRVPYQETIRRPAKAHGRHKKQTGGRGQFGDCHIEIEPLPDGDGLRVRQRDQGRRDPDGLHPGRREGLRRGDARTAPSPASRSRACGCASSTAPTTRSTPREMAFKMAGSHRHEGGAGAGRRRCCSSRSCSSRSACPTTSVGDVIGDLNSRRGRPQGMEPAGGMTEVKAEVPMAEMLTYAPDLRSLTGGQGDYTMEFVRYEEVPAHLAQKVIDRGPQRKRRRSTPERLPTG